MGTAATTELDLESHSSNCSRYSQSGCVMILAELLNCQPAVESILKYSLHFFDL